MKTKITGRNIQLTPVAYDYIERKLSKLSRHLTNITDSMVEVSEEKTRSPQQQFVAQITIETNGFLLRAENRGENISEAIDKVTATMDRRIERFKGKLYKKKGVGSPTRSKFSREVETVQSKLIKVKRFVVKPMPVTEAIDQMELLGHDFFLFFNTDSEDLNLLYRRKDSHYGLIEPQLK